jgi:hypothetical protein
MNELRQFLMRYIAGDIEFAAFRRAFVERFLTTASADSAVWQAVLQIESACADFSEDLIQVDELKRRLGLSVQSRRPATSTTGPDVVILLSGFEAYAAQEGPQMRVADFQVLATNSNLIASSFGPSNLPKIVTAEPVHA